MKKIREVRVTDVEKIHDLFGQVYGKNYPFTDLYDAEWLKKAVYDNNTVFLIMENDDEIVATVSMMLTSGDMDDMIVEAGRFVAAAEKRF